MPHLEVFEDVTAPSLPGAVRDPTVVRFASDVEWLRANGVVVERHNLAHHPVQFSAHVSVKEVVERGRDQLPVVVLDGRVISQGEYPSNSFLANLLGLDLQAAKSLCSPAVEELIGLAVAAVLGDDDSFKYHYLRCKKLNVSDEDLYEALVTGLAEKGVPGLQMRDTVRHFMTEVAGVKEQTPRQNCC
jgi:hypothetical protein